MFQRRLPSAATVTAGLRLADSTLTQDGAIDRWLSVDWPLASRWRLRGSSGVTYQFPGLEEAKAWPAPASLRPERATHVDAGVSGQLSASVSWDVTVFARRERDALRVPYTYRRPIPSDAADVAGVRYENALRGSATGMELTLARAGKGLSGWIAYAYGVARSADAERQEVYPSDFDQRQAISISATAPLSSNTRLGLTFRGATHFPIAGYFVVREGRLFAGSERNQTRLPAYARLDVRAERTFTRARHRVIVFGEALNVLNRANYGPADGSILDTGEAVGFSERLFPRLLTAGLRFEF